MRPTKLTPEVADRIVEAIRLGYTYEDAAKAGGVTRSSPFVLPQWL